MGIPWCRCPAEPEFKSKRPAGRRPRGPARRPSGRSRRVLGIFALRPAAYRHALQQRCRPQCPARLIDDRCRPQPRPSSAGRRRTRGHVPAPSGPANDSAPPPSGQPRERRHSGPRLKRARAVEPRPARWHDQRRPRTVARFIRTGPGRDDSFRRHMMPSTTTSPASGSPTVSWSSVEDRCSGICASGA
jgi:hypothetical protein